jgi:enoyl-CoA hydratase
MPSPSGYVPSVLTSGPPLLEVDHPDPHVRRLTLNRPGISNALNNELKGQLLDALYTADADPEVRVVVVRGAGRNFCAGYDMTMDRSLPQPVPVQAGDGQFQRGAVEMWTKVWDLGVPVITQIHGYAVGGGSELAVGAADLAFCTRDARIGYPPVRAMGLPDLHYFTWFMPPRAALLMLLTGDTLSGEEAVQYGLCNGPPAEDLPHLERIVLGVAQRVAKVPKDLQRLNKRAFHRQMECKGIRQALRFHTDLQVVSMYTETSKKKMAEFGQRGADKARRAFRSRDEEYGDNKARSSKM